VVVVTAAGAAQAETARAAATRRRVIGPHYRQLPSPA
jgi:hypothetical protein